MTTRLTDDLCHCGRLAIEHVDGNKTWTRGLCEDCDSVRCDAPQDGQRYSCQNVTYASDDEVLRIAAEGRKRWDGALALLAKGEPDGPSAVEAVAIREALSKATPGPWHRVEDVHLDATVKVDGDPLWVGELERVCDAELIVLLRNNAEALLDALENLRINNLMWVKDLDAMRRERDEALAGLATTRRKRS